MTGQRKKVRPDVAQHLNSNGIAIMLMMHTASEMLRALSPVAGVIIIVAGFAKVSPFAIIKRTAPVLLRRRSVGLLQKRRKFAAVGRREHHLQFVGAAHDH